MAGWRELDATMHAAVAEPVREMNKTPVYSQLITSTEQLRAEREEFMAHFERDEAYTPQFTPKTPADVVLAHREAIRTAWDTVAESSIDTPEEQFIAWAYKARVEEVTHGLDMVSASHNRDMKAFNSHNEAIYGPIESEYLACAGLYIVRDAERLLQAHPNNSDARSVIDSLGPVAAEKPFVEQSLFETVREAYQPWIREVTAGLPSLPPHIERELGKQAVAQMLRNIGADYTIEDTTLKTASVLHSRKVIKYPDEVYTPERFVGLYGLHELGMHIAENLNAERLGVHILKFAFAGAERAGEGKGVIGEQIMYRSLDEFFKISRGRTILLRHIAGALAVGGKNSFDEVYRTVHTLFSMYGQLDGQGQKEAKQGAHDQTWQLLAKRTHKGTTGPGAAYLKDSQTYFPGSVDLWRALGNNPGLVEYFRVGKANLLDSRVAGGLEDLGITPKGSLVVR